MNGHVTRFRQWLSSDVRRAVATIQLIWLCITVKRPKSLQYPQMNLGFLNGGGDLAEDDAGVAGDPAKLGGMQCHLKKKSSWSPAPRAESAESTARD